MLHLIVTTCWLGMCQEIIDHGVYNCHPPIKALNKINHDNVLYNTCIGQPYSSMQYACMVQTLTRSMVHPCSIHGWCPLISLYCIHVQWSLQIKDTLGPAMLSFVAREVVLFSEEKSSLSRRVLYWRFHCIIMNVDTTSLSRNFHCTPPVTNLQ